MQQIVLDPFRAERRIVCIVAAGVHNLAGLKIKYIAHYEDPSYCGVVALNHSSLRVEAHFHRLIKRVCAAQPQERCLSELCAGIPDGRRQR